MKRKENYALVTGGTSGIGYELVKLLAADGYRTKDPSILYARATFFSLEVVM